MVKGIKLTKKYNIYVLKVVVHKSVMVILDHDIIPIMKVFT